MFKFAHISDIHLGPLPQLTLRELFSSRKLVWREIRSFEVGQAKGIRPYRAGFAVLGDGSKRQLPGIGETAFAPDQPEGLVRRPTEELAAHNS